MVCRNINCKNKYICGNPSVICFYCGKYGHIASCCFKRKQKQINSYNKNQNKRKFIKNPLVKHNNTINKYDDDISNLNLKFNNMRCKQIIMKKKTVVIYKF